MTPAQDVGSVPGIALIGMSGRFPGAPDLATFWSRLRSGEESIRFFSDEELLEAGCDPELVRHPAYVKAASVLGEIDRFDASFFGYSPREACLIDPQQRMFLECAWEALERAGTDPGRFEGRIGVYGGAKFSSYLLGLIRRRDLLEAVGLQQAVLGCSRDHLATRVAFKMGLEGPAVTVQTACSTSLVAVHMACQALLDYETDMALAGAASIRVPQIGGYLYEEDGVLSPDGHTRPFDAAARGTVFGSGVGVVALKRLEDALADRDPILAVLRGSAFNNDGSEKAGYTAPNQAAQARVVADALGAAGVEPDTIGYVEAHGTGTALGDPIEVSALTRAYREWTDRTGFCALGSIKSNLGHVEAASGIAGLCKTVLALRHGEIPPTLHFETPNPVIDFDDSPFFVNDRLREWPGSNGPRRAGVSSFGFGGTNVHLIVEEAPATGSAEVERSERLWVVSARTEAALQAGTRRLESWLTEARSRPDHAAHAADAAYTLQVGRQTFEHRATAVLGEGDDPGALADRWHVAHCARRRRPVAFLFPGQGAQHVGMGRGLYATEPVYRRELDRIAKLAEPHLGNDLRDVIDPPEGDTPEAIARLTGTDLAQPALFAVEVALARQWMAWGVRPAALLGHSVGEVAAACIGGSLDLEDAVRLVVARGRILAAAPPGAMLAVDLPGEEALREAGDGLDLAAINGPSAAVLSGPEKAIDAVAQRLEERGIGHRRLHTSHAFHSASMDPVLPELETHLANVPSGAPEIAWVSNVTGTWIGEDDATDPTYWLRHARRPVRFAEAIETLAGAGDPVLLEVGPGDSLTRLVRRQAKDGSSTEISSVSSMRHPRQRVPDSEVLLDALGRLWTADVEIDWEAFHGPSRRRRVPLPTYPFERRRHWLDIGVQPTLRELQGGGMLPDAPAEPRRPAVPEPLDLGDEEPPADDVDASITKLWRGLLGVDSVRPEDDFFEMGGDSLLATSLLSRLRDRFDVQLSLETLFEKATPAQLGEAIRNELDRQPGEGAPIPLEPVDFEEDPPLSFAQRRLWFLDQLSRRNVAYNLPSALELDGILSGSRLSASLGEVIRRHETLRTTFRSVAGDPVQVIHPPQAPERLPVVDLTALPEVVRDVESMRQLAQEARRPFDLEQGPLLRPVLVRMDRRKHDFLLTLHHIVADGWSWGILRRELAVLYESFAEGRPSPLGELEIQYADFAHWQHRMMRGDHLEIRLDDWTRRLEGAPPTTELPTDRPRPAVLGADGALVEVPVPSSLARAAAHVSGQQGVTGFTTLLTVFAIFLSRATGQLDVLLGSPVAGRDRSEVEPLIGFLVNALVLRADLSGRPTVATLIERMGQVSLEAQAHQDLPFELLVDHLQPTRDLSRTPLFQVVFALQTAPADTLSFPDVEVSPLLVHTATAKFDLVFQVVRRSKEDWSLVVEYRTDLFDPTTVLRWTRHYVRLLEAALEDPTRPAAELPWWAPAQRHQILREWNDTRCERSEAPRIEERFLEQAAQQPDAPAVIFEDRVFTYRQVQRRSERLAGRLRALGVGPGTWVGVLLDRGPEMIWALLGVLRAGGAYVPLEATYPEARMRYILGSLGASVLLTDTGTTDDLGVSWSVVESLDHVIAVDGLSPEEPWPEGAPASRSHGGDDQDPAYVIFTSGSTGTPKGVMVRHRPVINLIDWLQETFDFGSEDRVLFVTSLCFDLSVFDVFGILATGGSVRVASRAEVEDPRALARILTEEPITFWDSAPAALQRIAPLLPTSPVPDGSLRRVFLSGDWVPLSLPGRVRDAFPETRVVALGGATEATVWSNFHVVEEEIPDHWTSIPYGRPIANARYHVLDEELAPCPIGIAGDLYIGGACLSSGYFGSPRQTALQYVPDPFAAAPGSVLYRTGDRAQHWADGTLEFLGRLDHQVKIRGFRIELGEIAAVLRRHDDVGDVVVTVHEDASGSRRLVAYATLLDGEPETADVPQRLRSHAAEHLPEYMVPAHVLVLDAFPMTSNGKLDREALPAPDEVGQSVSEPMASPRNETEAALVEIWRRVLRRDDVGIHENFFELGGDSILSIQVVARAQEKGLRLEARHLFRHQTVAELAAVAVVADPLVDFEEVAEPPELSPGDDLSSEDFPEADLSGEDFATLLEQLEHE